MRKLAEFSVKNSLFVNLISVFVILAGLFAVINMRREAFPNVSFDVAQIMTTYRGSTADQVEKLITSPIEKEIRSVSGIDEISSTSYDGSSVISVKIDPDVKDKTEVINDLRRAVDRVKDLPVEIDKPIVYDIKMKEHPIIMVSISGDVPEETLQEYSESLEDRFLDISGVSKIERRGYRDKQIWVEVDPQKLVDYYVSMEEVMDALQRHNVTIPGGKLKSEGEEYVIRTSAEFYSPEEIEGVIIRANDAGNILMVKDIAVVKNSFEDADIINKSDGKKAVTLVVVKKETADAITTVDQVKTVVKQAQQTLPKELSISLSNDLSYFIKRRLNILRSNGIFGFILVIILLFTFLTPVSAAFTALGLLVAFLATFTMMSLLGITINLISMFGLIMVLGIVVDDSIIISENVYRYVEEGLSPKEAAIKGASQVMLPVLSTVLTTIAAFAPLLFMSGLIGKFIKVIPQVVIIALTASLLEAFIILPSHLADFLKPIKQTFLRKEEKLWFKWMLNNYSRFLNKALDLRYILFSLTGILFIGSIIFAVKFMPFILFSGKGLEQFMIRGEAPLGTSLDKTNEMMKEIETIVGTIPKDELDTYTTEIGQLQEERGYDPNAKKGSQYAQVTIYLSPAQQRKRTATEIADSLRPRLKELEKQSEFEKIFVSVMKEGPPTGKPVEIRIRGDGYETLNEIGAKVISELSQIPGVYDIKSNYGYGKLELKVNIDEDMAKTLGLSISSVATSVRNAFDGGIATKVKRPKAEKEIEVLVRFPLEYRKDIKNFEKLLVPNINGKLIPLSKVATLEYTKGISDIRHLDGKRSVAITAEVNSKVTTPLNVANIVKKKLAYVPDEYLGYILKFGGEQEETFKSMMSLVKAFFLAFILIFVILTTQFRSLVQPFVVMLAIPFGIIGVIFAFYLHSEPFSFLGILGIIGLCGVVVNDSIVLMDFINHLRRNGIDRRDSIIQAGMIRMRPVLLTTVTTVFGLVPTVYGIGGFDPFVRPMALAIASGLLFATFLTLIILPCSYAIVDDVTLRIFHKSSLLKINNNNAA